VGDEAGGVARLLTASWTAWTSRRMAFVVGCVVGSCCNEVSVSLASRRKARRVGVWMEDDELFGASKAVRSATAVLISCWMFRAMFTMLWELGVHGGRVAAGG
jgi:hypothetical protein